MPPDWAHSVFTTAPGRDIGIAAVAGSTGIFRAAFHAFLYVCGARGPKVWVLRARSGERARGLALAAITAIQSIPKM